MGNPTLPPQAVSIPAKGSWWADRMGESAFGDLLARLTRQEQKATDQKEEYAEKLETATGSEVFKYFLLINVASLEKYVAQTRIQAQLSFRLCKRMSQWSFFLILLGVFIAIVSPVLPLLAGKWPALGTAAVHPLAPAELAALAGLITQFVSSVFFYFYNRTLQQFNLFGERLSAAQRVAISLLVNGSITDDAARNSSSAELAKALLAYSAPPEPQTQGQAEVPA
ncbi:MAG TPA: hypothetical protein VI455_04070 [Terriglobia bacterium]